MDLFRFDPPELTDAEAAQIAHDLYGIEGERKRLRGERSHNTRFSCADGRRYVLKVASASEPFAAIDLHAQALTHLERRDPHLPVARLWPARDGTMVPLTEREGRKHAVQLVTFLPGVPFADGQRVSLAALGAIGSLLGELTVALADFDHPAAAGFMPWDIANGLILDPELWDGLDADASALLDAARPRLEAATDAMATLPRQVIHNDGHAGNLLRADEHSEQVTGVIDFGDLVHTVTAADLGVSGANFVPHQGDPTAALAALTVGFHAHRPLVAAEVAALPDLVLARLALSTLLVEYQIHHAPHIADAVAAERPGLLAGLGRWLAIDPRVAARRIEEEL